MEGIQTIDQKKTWKTAKWGIIAFCVIHFFYEIFTGNSKGAAFPILFNYFISAWYIKGQIGKGKILANPFLSGLATSGVVFLIRLLLGAIFYFLVV